MVHVCHHILIGKLLLGCKFKGTVCHLKLLVDRYKRNENAGCKNPRKDTLYNLCLSLRKRTPFKQRAVWLKETLLISEIFLLSSITQKISRILPFVIRRVEIRSFLLSVTVRKNCEKNGEKKLDCHYNWYTKFCFCFALPHLKKHRSSQSTADVYSFLKSENWKMYRLLARILILKNSCH